MASIRKKASPKQSAPARVGIINAINSPLGFYVLALLIVEATIGMVLVKSDLAVKDKFYGLLLAVGMFVFVVFVVTLLVWHKPENLTFNRDAHLIRSRPAETEEIEVTRLKSLLLESTAKDEAHHG